MKNTGECGCGRCGCADEGLDPRLRGGERISDSKITETLYSYLMEENLKLNIIIKNADVRNVASGKASPEIADKYKLKTITFQFSINETEGKISINCIVPDFIEFDENNISHALEFVDSLLPYNESKRFSLLLVFQLTLVYLGATVVFNGDKSPGIRIPGYDLQMTLQSISDPSSLGLKEPSIFRNLPLQGLWHQHILLADPSAMATNLINQHGRKDWLSKRIHAALSDKPDGSLLTNNDIRQLSKIAVEDAFKERESKKSVTGEWVIFRKNDGYGEYFTLAVHDEADADIFSRISGPQILLG